MKRIKYKQSRKIKPNLFEYTGIHTTEPVSMQLFVYDDDGYEEYKNPAVDTIKREVDDPTQVQDVKWLNVHGLHDVNFIKNIGEGLDIDPFIISDVLNVTRRSKMEEMDDLLFFSIKSVLPGVDYDHIRVEQISFLLRGDLLISFQEKKSDFFSHIRERIKTHSGIVRKKRSDFLLYLLLEAIIENFYITLEHDESCIESLIADAKTSDSPAVLESIEKSRDDLNFLKRSILPLRDALYGLKSMREDNDFTGIEDGNYSFFARLHQKTLELLEQIDYDTNLVDSASNFYFSMQSHRMNQIMKVLTVVSVIFMPLTFIVGVYGMNFENMPELKWQYGYFMVMGVMFVIAVGMWTFFKKRKWF